MKKNKISKHVSCVTLITILLLVSPHINGMSDAGMSDAPILLLNNRLLMAARLGNVEMAEEVLINDDADKNARDLHDRTPLHIAAGKGHLKILNLLFLKYKECIKEYINEPDGNKQTPLHRAASKGKLSCLAALLGKEEADPEAQDWNHHTPLFVAIIKGQVCAARILLDKRANQEVKNKSNEIVETALHLAARYGQIPCLRLLQKYPINIKCTSNDMDNSPLHLAAAYNRISCVYALIDGDTDKEAPNCEKHTPLHVASLNGNIGCVIALIEKGANKKAKDWNDHTPLHLAVKYNKPGCVDHLLKEDDAEDKTEAKDLNFNTALHLAGLQGYKECTQILLDHNARTDSKNYDGKTPLDLAKEFQPHLIKIFEKPLTKKD